MKLPRLDLAMLFALLGLGSFTGCASVPVESVADEPAWINKPETAFPADRYLVAVGSGATRDQAIADARKTMAESFAVKVNSITESQSGSTLNQDTAGSTSGSATQDVKKNITLHTETWLRGGEVKEVYFQEAGKTFFALFALDKLKARSGLMLESNRIKNQLETTLESLEDQYTQKRFEQAKNLFAQFESLYGEASALGMSALVEVSPLEARLNRVEAKVRGKNKLIPFSVKTVQGETYFERDIESCINDRGGSLYDKNDQANKIEISVVERPQHLAMEGWTRIRFDLTASIVQINGKKYRIQTTQTETGRNRNAILETVSDKLSAELCDQLFARIGEMNP